MITLSAGQLMAGEVIVDVNGVKDGGIFDEGELWTAPLDMIIGYKESGVITSAWMRYKYKGALHAIRITSGDNPYKGWDDLFNKFDRWAAKKKELGTAVSKDMGVLTMDVSSQLRGSDEWFFTEGAKMRAVFMCLRDTKSSDDCWMVLNARDSVDGMPAIMFNEAELSRMRVSFTEVWLRGKARKHIEKERKAETLRDQFN